MDTPILEFDEAIKESEGFTRNLLLGNGFSMAYDPKMFHYQNLYSEAKETIEKKMPQLNSLFEDHGWDFEKIINMLQQSEKVLSLYLLNDRLNDHSVCRTLLEHAEELKNLLAESISNRHPETINSILNKKYDPCMTFFSKFIKYKKKEKNQSGDLENNPYNKNGGKIYTLNYDILLYWTLMRSKDNKKFGGEGSLILKSNDGFGYDEEDQLAWMSENIGGQNTFYLHGAIHLFMDGYSLKKRNWSKEGIAIMKQIREAMDKNIFPLFVAEGQSDIKLKKIQEYSYLDQCYKSYKKLCQKDECLFIYGHSLDKNDDHIINEIGNGSLPYLFVSVYGDHKTDDNQRIIHKAKGLESRRPQNNPLRVHFYRAESAQVWG